MVLITGAGRGIGLGIAQVLAGRGARLAINDYFAERALEAARSLRDDSGAEAIAVPADICSETAVATMVEAAVAALGPVDIIVNNAGIPPGGMEPKRFVETTPQEWDEYLDINLRGVMLCTHAVLSGMCERGWGRVISIVSEGWRAGTGMGISAYAAGKGGAVGLSRQLSSEVARAGVTVNCVSLGPMDNIDMKPTHIPVGRLGSPADVAAAIVYLASDEAAWVTGQVLPVNGGLITA